MMNDDPIDITACSAIVLAMTRRFDKSVLRLLHATDPGPDVQRPETLAGYRVPLLHLSIPRPSDEFRVVLLLHHAHNIMVVFISADETKSSFVVGCCRDYPTFGGAVVRARNKGTITELHQIKQPVAMGFFKEKSRIDIVGVMLLMFCISPRSGSLPQVFFIQWVRAGSHRRLLVLLFLLLFCSSSSACRFFNRSSTDIVTSRVSLDLCCAIANNKRLYNVEELRTSLPEDLFSICFGSKRCSSEERLLLSSRCSDANEVTLVTRCLKKGLTED